MPRAEKVQACDVAALVPICSRLRRLRRASGERFDFRNNVHRMSATWTDAAAGVRRAAKTQSNWTALFHGVQHFGYDTRPRAAGPLSRCVCMPHSKRAVARMWVNQPSRLQTHHTLHGELVLAMHEYGDTYTVYFTHGEVVSQQLPMAALSAGWPKEGT